jgi:hypothetical protein
MTSDEMSLNLVKSYESSRIMAKSLCFRRKERPHGHPLFFFPGELRQKRDAIYRRQCPLCDALHPLTASLLLHLRIYHNIKARSFTKSQIISSFEKVPGSVPDPDPPIIQQK